MEDNIKLLRTNHIGHPAKLHSDISCIVCKRKVIEDELVRIRYRYLLKHEEMLQREGPEKNKRRGKIEIYDALQVLVSLSLLMTYHLETSRSISYKGRNCI